MNKNLLKRNIGCLIACLVILGFVVYLIAAQGPALPKGLDAEATMAQYFDFWQEKEYNAMARMWNDADESLAFLADRGGPEGYLSSLKKEPLVRVVNIKIETDQKTLDELAASYPEYAETAVVSIVYEIKSESGGIAEEKREYWLRKKTVDSDWRIFDAGPPV